jgi:hypothetical protein
MKMVLLDSVCLSQMAGWAFRMTCTRARDVTRRFWLIGAKLRDCATEKRIVVRDTIPKPYPPRRTGAHNAKGVLSQNCDSAGRLGSKKSFSDKIGHSNCVILRESCEVRIFCQCA